VRDRSRRVIARATVQTECEGTAIPHGDCLPSRDFPVLIDLYRKGRLDLDGFVSEIITVNDVEDAFSKIMKSEVLRSVVVFTPR